MRMLIAIGFYFAAINWCVDAIEHCANWESDADAVLVSLALMGRSVHGDEGMSVASSRIPTAPRARVTARRDRLRHAGLGYIAVASIPGKTVTDCNWLWRLYSTHRDAIQEGQRNAESK